MAEHYFLKLIIVDTAERLTCKLGTDIICCAINSQNVMETYMKYISGKLYVNKHEHAGLSN